jgi:hypothetical protein
MRIGRILDRSMRQDPYLWNLQLFSYGDFLSMSIVRCIFNWLGKFFGEIAKYSIVLIA